MAAKSLRINEVPVILIEHLSEAQMRALAIADNRLTDLSVWDERMLADEMKALSELELDFDIEVTGFEIGEIDIRIASLDAPIGEGEIDPADEAKTPKGPAVSRLGDLWILDKHRVLCRNSLQPASFRALMMGETAAMVFSDPPYNIRISDVSGRAVKHREFAMAVGEMNEAEFTSFLSAAFILFAENATSGSLHYVCMDWRHMAEILTAGRAAYAGLKNLCVWNKTNAGMGSLATALSTS